MFVYVCTIEMLKKTDRWLSVITDTDHGLFGMHGVFSWTSSRPPRWHTKHAYSRPSRVPNCGSKTNQHGLCYDHCSRGYWGGMPHQGLNIQSRLCLLLCCYMSNKHVGPRIAYDSMNGHICNSIHLSLYACIVCYIAECVHVHTTTVY